MAASSSYDVLVLGAGAAGLMCAFTAARRGRTVLVLEKSNKSGKKILMSGGGRCNFTNQLIDADNFISSNPHFCKSALTGYSQWDFIAMVERHGIAYEERKHGQLFCLDSAREILQMLLEECQLAQVKIKTHCAVSTIKLKDGKGYSVGLEDGSIVQCSSLVVATGALSIPTLGGSDIGYTIAQQFGLALKERRAGLVPFMFSSEMKQLCESLSGLSVPVTISCHKQSFTEDLLFTHRGMSGPAVLQISNYWHPGEEVTVDLLPGTDAGAYLLAEKKQQAKMHLRSLLSRKLARALVKELEQLWWPEQAEIPLADFSDKQLVSIGARLNCWSVKPSTTEGYRTAEVTLGGVDTNELSSKTMEAKKQPDLYFIGEVLDVTGHLGGFNFQWAWSSGFAAGKVA